MRLYHASTSIIEKPDVLHSRDKLDFGKGFYLTTIREQAGVMHAGLAWMVCSTDQVTGDRRNLADDRCPLGIRSHSFVVPIRKLVRSPVPLATSPRALRHMTICP